MYSVYILKSLTSSKRYIGHTGKDVSDRLNEHNKTKQTAFDKAHAPFILIYQENKILSRSDAMKREKFLKSGKGREWLDITLL